MGFEQSLLMRQWIRTLKSQPRLHLLVYAGTQSELVNGGQLFRGETKVLPLIPEMCQLAVGNSEY